MADTIIDLRSGARTLPSGQAILHDVEFSMTEGQSVAVIGRSGSGKSTLLSALGLITPFDAHSEYRLAGRDVRELRDRDRARWRAEHIGFVLQNSGLIGHLSALENVRMPLLHSRRVSPSRALILAKRALERMGIAHLAKRRPEAVSGGERQRVAIARALVVRPKLILADEPTGALDTETGRTVLDEILSGVDAAEAALIVVTHDQDVAARMDRVLRLHSGRLHPVTIPSALS